MKPPTAKQAASEIIDLLADLLGSSPKAILMEEGHGSNRIDLSISVPGYRWLAAVSTKASASVGPLALHSINSCNMP